MDKIFLIRDNLRKQAIMTRGLRSVREALARSMQMKTRVKPRRAQITRRCALRVSQPQTEPLQTFKRTGLWPFITRSVQVGEYSR